MRLSCRYVALAAILVSSLSTAQAAPITYSIAFGAGSSPTPTGSFVYDGALAANKQFVSFTVAEQGLTFDFTIAANNFTFRTDAGSFHTSCDTPTVNDAFEILTNAACVANALGAGLRQWQFGGNVGIFQFAANSGTPPATDSFDAFALVQGGFLRSDTGNSYLATAIDAPPSASVPEPASIALLAVGIVGFGIGRRKRSR